MGRRLPEPITRAAGESDEEYDSRYATSKRRQQLFKRIYQNYYHWQALRETGEVSDIITIEGEEVYIGDLMTGIDTLPRRQRQAFELICLRGYTEGAATAILLPNSNWSTPVQQYSDDGLKKMIAAYDARQAGTWDPEAHKKRRTITRKKDSVTTAEKTRPEVPDDIIDEPPQPLPAPDKKSDRWDWDSWSADHESLAQFIKAESGVDITAQQVKAVSFLRRQWYESPEQVAERERRRAEREEQRNKFAYESPQQRQDRLDAVRKLKSAELLQERLKNLQEEARALRAKAGLDPDTGEPLAHS